MSGYRNEWPCCGDETYTEAWEPERCPFCELNDAQDRIAELETELEAARAQQSGEGRAIGEIDEGEEGVFVDLYPDNTFTIGQKVYTHTPKAQVVPEDIRCHLREAVKDLYPLDTWQIVKASREELQRFNNLRNLVVAILDLTTTPPADKPEAEWVKDVVAERQRQDQKWGGPQHDDQKSPNDFVQHIEDYAGWARVMAGMGSFDKYRRRMVQVAAIAGAAIEASDRAMNRAAGPDMGGEK